PMTITSAMLITKAPAMARLLLILSFILKTSFGRVNVTFVYVTPYYNFFQKSRYFHDQLKHVGKSRLNIELDIHGIQLLAAIVNGNLQPDHRIRFKALCVFGGRRSQRRIADCDI